MPTITIILPMYQVASFVQGAIRSIQAQSFCDFECICVDDGSLDRSVELAREAIADDKRFLIIEQENKMVGGARNTGMQYATGDYITFIDSDDYIHPTMLEVLHHAMLHYNADIAGCRMQRTPNAYSQIKEMYPADKVHIYDDVLHSYIRTKKIATSVWARLYKRKLIADIPFFENMCYEDTPWTPAVLARCQRLVIVDAPLYYYYYNESSIMRTVWSESKTVDFLKGLRSIHERFSVERPELLEEIKRYRIMPTLKMVFNRISRCSKEQRHDLWVHAAPLIKDMYSQNIISYKGLKLKHKVRLYWLLRLLKH